MGGACNAFGGEGRVYRVLVGKPDWKRALGKPRRRREDNIKIDLQEVGCGDMDWIELAQNRDIWLGLLTAVMNLRVPLNVGNFLTSWQPISFTRKTVLYGVGMLCFFTTHCSLRLIVRSELDVSTFATRLLDACHHARAPSGGRWNWGREMSGNFT
jgi:hypothetical protein